PAGLDGYYLVGGGAQWAPDAQGQYAILKLRKNGGGTDLALSGPGAPDATGYLNLVTAAPISVAGGYYVDLIAHQWQSPTGTRDVVAGSAFLWCARWSGGAAGAGGSLATDPLADVKGDLFAASANDAIGRLAVGSNDQVLVADSTQSLGVKWGPVPGLSGYLPLTGGTLTGDLTLSEATPTLSLKLAADTQPRSRLSATALAFGPGGTTAPDTTLTRTAAQQVGLNGTLTLTPAAGQAALVVGGNGYIDG